MDLKRRSEHRQRFKSSFLHFEICICCATNDSTSTDKGLFRQSSPLMEVADEAFVDQPVSECFFSSRAFCYLDKTTIILLTSKLQLFSVSVPLMSLFSVSLDIL